MTFLYQKSRCLIEAFSLHLKHLLLFLPTTMYEGSIKKEVFMGNLIHTLDTFLWGWPLILVLIGTHIFMTIRTGFIQKEILHAIKLSVTDDEWRCVW